MLITLGALVLFYFYFLLLGLPFIRFFNLRIHTLAQLQATGFLIHIASFYALSDFGFVPKSVFPYFLGGAFLLASLLILFDRRTRLKLKDGFSCLKEGTLGFLILSFFFFSVSSLFSYEAPFLFFNKSDTLYYVSLADYHWNHSFESLRVTGDFLKSNLYHIAKNHFSARSGMWHAFVPAYAAFGANPYYYFAPLLLVFWNMGSLLSLSLARTVFPDLMETVRRKEYLAFYFVPFFAFIGFEDYMAQFIFTIYFVWIMVLCERLRQEILSINVGGLFCYSITLGFAFSAVLISYPEFLLAPLLISFAFFCCSLCFLGKKKRWRDLRHYIFFSTIMLTGMGIVIFFLLEGGVYHGFEQLVAKFRGNNSNFFVLRKAFRNDVGTYLLNTIGFPFYSTILKERAFNLLGIFYLGLMAIAKPSLKSFFSTALGVSFLLGLFVFSYLQVYASIKYLACWSLVITPLFILSADPKKRIFLILFMASQLAYMIYSFDNYRGHSFIHKEFKGMKRVSDFIMERHKEKDVLMYLGNHIQSASFTILLSHHTGNVFSTLPTHWNRRKDLSKKMRYKYQKSVLRACDAIEEPLILVKKRALRGLGKFAQVKKCIQAMPHRSFGPFTLYFNRKA